MNIIFSFYTNLAKRQIQKPLKPERWLVSLKNNSDVQSAIQELQSFTEVQSDPLWLKDAGENERGILPELFIKPHANISLAFMDELSTHFNAENARKSSWLPGVFVLQFSKNSFCNAMEASNFLNNHPNVEYTDANMAFFPVVNNVNDSLFARQWSLKNDENMLQWNGTAGADMDVVNARTLTTGGPSVKIAILDSGVDTFHPDLTPNLLKGYNATGGISFGYLNVTFPSDGLGTICAGIAAAKGNNQIGVACVAYDCKIIPVRCFFIWIPAFLCLVILTLCCMKFPIQKPTLFFQE